MFVSASEFICRNPNGQRNDIWRWDFGEELDLKIEVLI
jgi:hypothetical protein